MKEKVIEALSRAQTDNATCAAWLAKKAEIRLAHPKPTGNTEGGTGDGA